MIWLFWGLPATILGGMLLLAVLARIRRSKLRLARPSTWLLLRAAAHSFITVLWTLSHPFGVYGRHRYLMDDPTGASKEYLRELERELEERGRSRRG